MIIESSKQNHLVILKRGEKLMLGLHEACQKLKLVGARLNGIGAIEDIELGYYNLHEKRYQTRRLSDGDYELLSFEGNLSEKEGQPFIHAHVTLGKEDLSTIGGHLFEATVAITAEIFITSIEHQPIREYDPETGLFLIKDYN